MIYSKDYRIITGSSKHPTMVLRHYLDVDKWCCYFQHEAARISTYDMEGNTAEEAIVLFVKHRINKEPFVWPDYKKGHVARLEEI